MAQFRMVDGVARLFEEFEKDLPRSIATAILGRSFEHMPIDTGHMMRQTRMFERKDGKGFQLVTSTDYAEGQYSEMLNHLIVGGRYQSISRAPVAITAQEGNELKTLRGGAKFQRLYWMKYAYLRAAGKLTPAKAEWFQKAYDEVMSGEYRAITAKRIAELRRKAREDAGLIQPEKR